MNSRLFCFLTMCCWFVVPAFGIDLPKSPPPELGEAVLGEGGQLQVERSFFYSWPVEKEVVVVVNGVMQTKKVAVPAWESGKMSHDISPSSYLVMTIGGERLDDAAVNKLFAEKRTVLVSSHGKRLDPTYAAAFKAETPVLYLRLKPMFGVPKGGGPAPLAPWAPQLVVMPPRQVTGVAANGKLTVIDCKYWQQFPLWKTKEVEERFSEPRGVTTKIKTVSVAEPVWAATKQIAEFPLADCQAIGHDGQPAEGVDLAARLAANGSVLWLQEGMTLDTRFCQFLNPDALIVKTPAPIVPAYEEPPLLYAPHLDFQLAQTVGDQIKFTKFVFEQQTQRVSYEVQVNGQTETRYKEVAITVSKPIHTMAKLSDYSAISPAENGLAAKGLPIQKYLARPRPVFVCEFPDGISAKQLNLLQPDVMILSPKGNRPLGPGDVRPEPVIDAPAPPPPPTQPVPQPQPQ